MTRLTAAARQDRDLSGGDLQRQITDLATMLGYAWVHFRPAKTRAGWRTPVEGPLGKGWPDLMLLRVRDRRLIFAELKRELGDPVTADQAAVLAALGELADGLLEVAENVALSNAGVPSRRRRVVRVYVWRPSDMTSGAIEQALR